MMVVMDSFALPVEGTETRVNAQAQGYEYMTAYIEAAKQVGRLENAIGWYHSHPGTRKLSICVFGSDRSSRNAKFGSSLSGAQNLPLFSSKSI